MSAEDVHSKQPRDFDPVNFSTLLSCRHEGLRTYASATFSVPRAAHSQMPTLPPSKRFRLTIILSTTMWNMHDGMGILLP